MAKPSVSVGIPAYNEEANIGRLLKSLLSQKSRRFILKEIIVCSDGSGDQTVSAAESLKNTLIRVIDNRERLGVAERENQILAEADSDVLVILNADIVVPDVFFLEKLALPIISGKADLASACLKELSPRNFFERCLAAGMEIKNRIFEKHLSGGNIYTCHGPARAFSRKLYKNLSFPESIGEDAYSYLYCISQGFQYVYVKEAMAYYRLPDNLADYQRQSRRFNTSRRLMTKIFGQEYVSSCYCLPLKLIIASTFSFLVQDPIRPVFYFFFLIYVRTKMVFTKNEDFWEIALSSKYLLED
jgi:glycosyltransferase involved in cell wall biosynthesis